MLTVNRCISASGDMTEALVKCTHNYPLCTMMLVQVGSIGVITSGFGLHKLLEKYDIERRVFTAGVLLHPSSAAVALSNSILCCATKAAPRHIFRYTSASSCRMHAFPATNVPGMQGSTKISWTPSGKADFSPLIAIHPCTPYAQHEPQENQQCLHACRPVKPQEVERLNELLTDLHQSFQVLQRRLS